MHDLKIFYDILNAYDMALMACNKQSCNIYDDQKFMAYNRITCNSNG